MTVITFVYARPGRRDPIASCTGLPALDAALPLAVIYKNVEFPAPDRV